MTEPNRQTFAIDPEAKRWLNRFLQDLAVVRPANTVRAYRLDLERWLVFCVSIDILPLATRPGHIIDFIRFERQRQIKGGTTISARTLVRRLSALRQWYTYLMLEPEQTGVKRNPVPGGSTLRVAAGIVSGQPALLHFDSAQPKTLTVDEMTRFIEQLTATSYRDRAIVWLLKDGAIRIGEVLDLRLGDIHWAGHRLTIRSSKSHNQRVVALTDEALDELGSYVRLERPKDLAHDFVFVCLGRRSFGQPFRYRAWVYICEQARKKAETPSVHAHAFRHTCATNLAEAGMPLDALQRQLGHRHIETTLIYNQVRDSRLQREYKAAMASVVGFGCNTNTGDEGATS
ncbi:MAG: tyrosine-type recombinase/integrase [Pyrinomonadaceae bacterium]